jgi:hypothetical protein
MRLPHFLALLLLLVCLPLAAAAQTSTTTTVSGTVTDIQGAAITGAVVKLTDVATNTERTATTDAEGRYVFNAVLPALYQLTVTAQGFKTKVVSDVKTEVTKVLTVNVTLEVG